MVGRSMKLSGAIRRLTSRTSKDEERKGYPVLWRASHGNFQNPVNAIFISLAIFSPVIERQA
jgi:hypothetical protein